MNSAAIQEFWTTFSQRAVALAKLDSAEDPIYDEILAKLHAINEALFFEFSTRGRKAELIVTAEGEKSLFGLVDDIVAAAPKVKGWSFIALKPKVGFARSITWEGHVIDCASVLFEPLEDEKSGDFGIRMLIPDLPDDKHDSAHNGLLRVLDHALGERRFADEIKFTQVTTLDGDADDYIPLSAIDRFIDWRKQKQLKKPAKTPGKQARAPARKKTSPAAKGRKAKAKARPKAKVSKQRPKRKR